MDGLSKFQQLLRKLFLFDAADVDFGIYRILNYRRDRVEEFITLRLPQIVEDAFIEYAKSEKETLQQEIELKEREIREKFGKQAFNEQGQLQLAFRDTPLGGEYLALLDRKKEYRVSEDLKTQIYNDLYNFFSRYYEDGDFIAKRRYGRHEAYAVPYGGEEVVLHWATKDQYYIKTGEHLKNYRFVADGYTVVFELRNATTEQNNNKGEKRYFVLASSEPIRWDEPTKTLTIAFEYRPLTDAEQSEYGKTEQQKPQDKLNENAAQAILEKVPDPTLQELLKSKPHDEQSLLQKHLTRFTRKNTSDFFIHKNLRGFLQRELDFFIKSECLRLDELLQKENEDLPRQHILRGRVVREIGCKIIEFLAQIEDFQKRLFEKKKFVIRTEYCITIDRVPEALWDEVLENTNQIEEWKQLYNLDTLLRQEGIFGSELTTEFLRKHPSLVVDTRHFSDDFKWRLLEHLDNLDDALDGVLIKSENFQALNLLMEKYRAKAKCIYIDPPYNTGNDGFLYKDRYQHSSWLSMMLDRLSLAREWMREDGAIFISCDDNEVHHLRTLCDKLWERIGVFVWEKKKKGSHLSPTFRDLTEYILGYASCIAKLGRLYGEQALSGVWQPLINRSNNIGVIEFPAGKVQTTLENGTYPARKYSSGDDEMAVDLLDDIVVHNGIVQVPFRLRARFKWKQETLDKELSSGTKVKLSKNMRPTVLRSDQEEKTKTPPSLITKDIATYEDAFSELSSIFGAVRYSYPKPSNMIKFLVNTLTFFDQEGIILDFFAGSGTTAQAVIDLNRHDEGDRKYILAEMGEWFETVLLPRIKKVVFCDQWKNGEPNGGNGVSHFLKYQYLEQYEDTLNNLELRRKAAGQLAFEQFGDEYLLRYMLDFETQGSSCLLDLNQFKDPFAYKLKVQEGDEIQERVVDLIETFNYLLGIQVKKMRQLENNGRLYRAVLGEKDGKIIAIVWRSVVRLEDDPTALQQDRDFIEKTLLPKLLGEGKKPDRLFANGICLVPSVEAIEPEFKRLIWQEGQNG